MRVHVRTSTMTAVVVAVAMSATAAFAKTASVTGHVGDTMCGATHMVKGDDAQCTRACVKGGAKHALLVKGKVYTLEANDAVKAELDKLAGQKVAVTGEQAGNTIEVASVRAAQ